MYEINVVGLRNRVGFKEYMHGTDWCSVQGAQNYRIQHLLFVAMDCDSFIGPLLYPYVYSGVSPLGTKGGRLYEFGVS